LCTLNGERSSPESLPANDLQTEAISSSLRTGGRLYSQPKVLPIAQKTTANSGRGAAPNQPLTFRVRPSPRVTSVIADSVALAKSVLRSYASVRRRRYLQRQNMPRGQGY
jgi:hypothetical protein